MRVLSFTFLVSLVAQTALIIIVKCLVTHIIRAIRYFGNSGALIGLQRVHIGCKGVYQLKYAIAQHSPFLKLYVLQYVCNTVYIMENIETEIYNTLITVIGHLFRDAKIVAGAGLNSKRITMNKGVRISETVVLSSIYRGKDILFN